MHTGGRHKKCISKGNCMGGWLLPTLPGNSLLSHISSHNIMLKMMINIIMRMVWKLMGDLVIITSLKPTNRLLSPRWWWGETETLSWYCWCCWNLSHIWPFNNTHAPSGPRLKIKIKWGWIWWNSGGCDFFVGNQNGQDYPWDFLHPTLSVGPVEERKSEFMWRARLGNINTRS